MLIDFLNTLCQYKGVGLEECSQLSSQWLRSDTAGQSAPSGSKRTFLKLRPFIVSETELAVASGCSAE